MSAPSPTPRARLACSTISLYPLPVREAFAIAAGTGFDAVEVMVTKDPDTRDAARLIDLAEEHALEIVAVHAPFLLVTRSVWGTDARGKIDRAVELAEAVGASIVVVHPPYRWQTGYRRWTLEELPRVPERTAVRVAVENMFPLHVRGRRVGAFHAIRTLEELAAFDHVVLDTSHAAVAGLDAVEALERLGGRLAHVHLSDNAGKGWDSHLPLGEGVVDLDRFVRALGDRGFAGTISFELDLRRRIADRDAVRRSLQDARAFCASRLPLAA